MTHMWVIMSLLSAVALATSDAYTKKALNASNEYLAALFRLIFSLPLLISILFLIPFPDIDRTFIFAIMVSLPLELAAFLLYIRALRISPLSLSLPFLSLTPVFLIFVSFIILGEQVSMQGAFGILCIAAGSYMLHFHEARKGLTAPFRAIIKEKGSVFMIATAIIYSVTSSLGKMAIMHSSPLFFGSIYFILFTVVFSSVALWKGRKDISDFISKKKYRALVFPGVCHSVMVVSHMIALSLAKVAYMISLKRTSLLIGVLYGYFLFRETNIKERMSGALLMFAGFVLIVTAK